MIYIQQSQEKHVQDIVSVCTKAYWATYRGMLTDEYISRTCKDFYNESRVSKEVNEISKYWGGYLVAVENEEVVGAGGGGMITGQTSEIYVLYLDPNRRNEGIGTRILEAITQQQKEFGSFEQWVSVQKGNQKGIPFYEAKGFVYQHERLGYGSKEDEQYLSLRYKRLL